MNIERPKGLVLNDITIKRNETSEESFEQDPTKNQVKPKADLLAGLISDDAQGGNIDNHEMIQTHLLDPFTSGQHPFKPYSEEEMLELVESVKMIGIQQSLIVRKKADGRYEILAGHNRCEAAKRAGLRTVPCKVVDVDDNTAGNIVIETNLKQRKKLAYSEIARAYKMQMDIFRQQGKRRDLVEAVEEENEKNEIGLDQEIARENDFGQSLPKTKYARDIVAERNKTSARTINMYIRLLELTEEMINKVDTERILFTVGVELSHVPKEMQERINALLDTSESLKIDPEAAKALHRMVKEGLSNEDLRTEDLLAILSGKEIAAKKKPKKAKTPFNLAFKAAENQFKKIDNYITKNIDQKALEKVVIDAVEEYLLKLRQ